MVTMEIGSSADVLVHFSLPLPIHYQGGNLPHLVHGVVL